MYKIGLIGSGFIGTVHAAAYQRIPNAELVAVADINEVAGKKIADEFSCKYYQQAEQMICDEQIDVVDICLPTFLHEQYVALAAKYHKHVLCEKPFGLSHESCQRMVQYCQDAGVALMVAQAVRWVPEFVKARELLQSGVFGDLHMVSSRRLSQAPAWTTWHRDPNKSGGGLYDLQVHNIDYLISLFGEVDRVSAIGWKSETGCWNHVVATLSFKNGMTAVDEGSLQMTGDYPFSVALRIVGDQASFDYQFAGGQNIENCDTATNSVILYEKDKLPRNVDIVAADAYELEIVDYLAAIENNTAMPIPPAESLYVMQVVEAIKKSLETGQTVRI